ncbi:MAG: Uma2 family endonuclease [Dehalococcoidia bacterium]
MTVTLTRRRFTVDEYHRMAEAGILHEDDRIELIDGDLIEMAAAGGRHIWCVIRLDRLFTRGLGDLAYVSVQNPVRLSPYGEPEPDIAVLRFDPAAQGRVPEAGDVLLLIEVADTTLAYDTEVKAPRYAAAGIPELWIADLTNDCIRVYRDPSPDGYRTITVFERGAAVTPVMLPSVTVAVDEILG